MAIRQVSALDRTFHALGDGSRRRMLSAVGEHGHRTAGQIGALFDVAQPTISKHLRVLEQAGLLRRRIEGRQHLFTLDQGLDEATAWLERHQALWAHSLDQLGDFLDSTDPGPEHS